MFVHGILTFATQQCYDRKQWDPVLKYTRTKCAQISRYWKVNVACKFMYGKTLCGVTSLVRDLRRLLKNLQEQCYRIFGVQISLSLFLGVFKGAGHVQPYIDSLFAINDRQNVDK